MNGEALRHPGINLQREGQDASPEQESDIFGFWVFLMSDAIVFALLFATYGTMLAATVGGPTPSSEYKIGSAFIETLVLLASSFSFGMASIAMKYPSPGANPRRLLAWLGATLALGILFLGMELHDFHGMFNDGAYPTRSGFLSAFFALVPLHGLHVLAGSLWMVVMMVQVVVFKLDERVRTNILRLGLFWHFLDIVWIAIFSAVYLQGLIR